MGKNPEEKKKFFFLERQSRSKKMHPRCGTAEDGNDNALATPTKRRKNRRPPCRVKNVCSLTSRAIPKSDRPSTSGLNLSRQALLETQLCFEACLPVTADRFHVLLNPLFRVLCNFPSRYLFAIGLVESYLALDGVYHPS